MRIQAVVLKKIPIKEHDALIVCYTQDAGKQVYHAKSILRASSKQASHLDVLNRVEFSLAESKQMPIVISSLCVEPYRALKASLPALAISYFLLECFDKLVFEAEADERLWQFLCGQLTRLNELDAHQTDWSRHLEQTQAELMEVMGYHRDVSLETIHPTAFNSLQFLQSVVR